LKLLAGALVVYHVLNNSTTVGVIPRRAEAAFEFRFY